MEPLGFCLLVPNKHPVPTRPRRHATAQSFSQPPLASNPEPQHVAHPPQRKLGVGGGHQPPWNTGRGHTKGAT